MKRITKTGIIYVAVDHKDANEFLKKTQEIIGNKTEATINLRQKTLETPDFFIEAKTLINDGIIRNYRAKYIVLSNRTFETSINEICKWDSSLKQIKANLLFNVRQISMEQLSNILRAISEKHCSICKWYSAFERTCCNTDSEYKDNFRCLNDSCKLWENGE